MRILIADDETGIRSGLRTLFERNGFAVSIAGEYDEALRAVREEEIQIALLDIRLGDRDGVELLKELKEIDNELICIMITGYGSIQNAVKAMKEGAADYLLKPLDNAKLLQTVKDRLQLEQLKAQNRQLKSELDSVRRQDRFVHRSPEMAEIIRLADKVKSTRATVLISGESGSGKEVLCRYIHETGNRRDGPLVGVNCAAIADSLMLSELFGHEKGAFTGAEVRKPGKFEIANGGTLFLDEIGDMPMEAQSKLLRVIEEGSFERVGGTRKVEVNIRLVAATNQDLPGLIGANRFREDLFYRLNVVRLEIPPLRQRREDIPELARYFTELFCRQYGKPSAAITPASLQAMEIYRWPGNVRELKNMINQAVLLSDGDLDLKPLIEAARHYSASKKSPAIEEKPLGDQVADLQEEHERRRIEEALSNNQYNRTAAAKELGITRKTLFNKMQKYGL